jgi:hypothetical protein
MTNNINQENKNIETKNNKTAKGKYLWLLLNIILFFLVTGLIIAIFLIFQKSNSGNASTPFSLKDLSIRLSGYKDKLANSNNQNIELVRRALDGVLVAKGKENYYPAAIIIENHIDARPPVSLAHANLVYEAEAEGGITRFLAIYTSGNELKKIGPIRSARSYFLDWVEELSAAFWHCGGSPDALAEIIKDNVIDINEFYNGSLYWRDQNRLAPHNIFTSSANLKKYLDEKGLTEGKFLTWEFKEDKLPENRLENQIVTINWPPGYNVAWHYNNQRNDYVRFMNNHEHQDENGDNIYAKNVLVQFIPAQVIDEEKRLKMDVVGKGRALVCQDGKCQEAIWQKNNQSSRTRFYNISQVKSPAGNLASTSAENLDTGEEFKFNAGTTWIEVVRPEIKVTY